MAAQQDAPCSYIVRDRDSLFDISQRFGLTTAAVQDANPDLGPDALIKAGDVLALPVSAGAP